MPSSPLSKKARTCEVKQGDDLSRIERSGQKKIKKAKEGRGKGTDCEPCLDKEARRGDKA